MYVCVCNAVTEQAIQEAVADGVRTFPALQAETGCGTCCGCCEPVATQVMEETMRRRSRGSRSPSGHAFPVLAAGSTR